MAADSPHRLILFAEWERRYDGPLPADDLPETPACRRGRLEGLHALHQRLAAAARDGAARRRRGLTAAALFSDRWLSRLALTVAGQRAAAIRSSSLAPDRLS